MKNFTCLLGALFLSTTAAHAGTPVPVMSEPPVAAPVASDWVGLYGGISYSSNDVDRQFGNSPRRSFGSGDSIGGFVGYNFQAGRMIYGGELAFMGLAAERGGASLARPGATAAELGPDEVGVENLFEAKARLGYDLGRVMVYGTIGYGSADYVHPKEEYSVSGAVYGVGAAFRVTDRVFAGVELLQRELKGRNAFSLVDTTYSTQSITARVGIQF